MLRKLPYALILAAALVAGPIAANAEDSDPEDYVPPSPTPSVSLLSLDGSTVAPLCSADVPWIDYSVVLTDPANVATGHTASLILSDGANSVTLKLGDLVNGRLSGRILWPGAAVAADGTAAGWPGWVKVGGTWVQTTGNFAWTRTITQATISVNPTAVVALSYPPATASCMTDPPGSSTSSTSTSALSSTGVSEMIIPVALAAVVLLVGGIVMLFPRRRRSSR